MLLLKLQGRLFLLLLSRRATRCTACGIDAAWCVLIVGVDGHFCSAGVLAGSHLVAAVAVDHLVGKDKVRLVLGVLVFADAAPGEVVGGRGEVGVELFWGQCFVVVMVNRLLLLLVLMISGVADISFVVTFCHLLFLYHELHSSLSIFKLMVLLDIILIVLLPSTATLLPHHFDLERSRRLFLHLSMYAVF